jgi:hypothetical protein
MTPPQISKTRLENSPADSVLDQATLSPESPVRDETGAVLILALVFLLAIGLIAGGLASWVSADLKNSLNFQNDRNVQYALSSTTQVAIQNIRYAPLFGVTLNATPPSYCWCTGPSSQLTYGNNQVAVWCSTVWNPSSSSTRVVTISACMTNVASTAAACAATPGLQTVVTFDDYSSSNPTVNPGFCLTPPSGTCGSGMTMNSSSSNTVNPTVTALSSTQGPLTGTGVLTVTGTGFVSNATATNTTVSFVSTNASSNVVLQGTGVNVTSPTSLTVAIPPATVLGGYYVIVSTPNGSSPAVNPSNAFTSQYTYQNVVPTVSSIATAGTEGTSCPSGSVCGSAAGGTALTISGTGFLTDPKSATTVNFVDTANPAVVLVVSSPFLTVNSYVNGVQTITVTTPGIAQDSTYYVTVTTAPGGTSAQGPIFTFQPFTPVVASVSPTTNGPRVVTITGIGFVSGATTVQLIPTSGNGATLTATAVSVSSSTTLTATIPTGGTTGRVYFVEVTTTTGGASCPTQQNGGCGSAVPQYTY